LFHVIGSLLSPLKLLLVYTDLRSFRRTNSLPWLPPRSFQFAYSTTPVGLFLRLIEHLSSFRKSALEIIHVRLENLYFFSFFLIFQSLYTPIFPLSSLRDSALDATIGCPNRCFTSNFPTFFSISFFPQGLSSFILEVPVENGLSPFLESFNYLFFFLHGFHKSLIGFP